MKSKLTGKCKADFFSKYMLDDLGFDLYHELFQNALIIEYFDSIGVYVSTPNFIDLLSHYQRGFESSVYNEKTNEIFNLYNEDGDVFNSRTEAINSAIEKANELINL